MASTTGISIPPMCNVDRCENPCRLLSKSGGTTYMKTCCRHNFMDLPGVREKMDALWQTKSNK